MTKPTRTSPGGDDDFVARVIESGSGSCGQKTSNGRCVVVWAYPELSGRIALKVTHTTKRTLGTPTGDATAGHVAEIEHAVGAPDLARRADYQSTVVSLARGVENVPACALLYTRRMPKAAARTD